MRSQIGQRHCMVANITRRSGQATLLLPVIAPVMQRLCCQPLIERLHVFMDDSGQCQAEGEIFALHGVLARLR